MKKEISLILTISFIALLFSWSIWAWVNFPVKTKEIIKEQNITKVLDDNSIKSISCYGPGGEGPYVPTNCPQGAKLQCNSEPNTNAESSIVLCPIW